jgi:hypothetical protein
MIQSTFFAGFLGGVIAGLRLVFEGPGWCDIAAQMTIDGIPLSVAACDPVSRRQGVNASLAQNLRFERCSGLAR